MEVAKTLTLNEKLPIQEQIRILDLNLSKLFRAFQGRVRFGDGADGEQGENIQGEFQSFTSSGADVEFSVTHTLGAIPIGFIVLHQDLASSLYQGPSTGTAWTATTISLKSNTGSTTYLVFLVK